MAIYDDISCFIYRSARKAETYLYVSSQDQFDQVPQPLLEQLGELTLVMELSLGPEQKLARANPAAVREALTARGYYLQPPPTRTPLMANDRL
ncbi:MAG: YcgL domain-containing protein [Lysobacterales bacterium]